MPKRELPAAQEPVKRHKALPFSIESIMQSAGMAAQQRAGAESPSLSGSSLAGSSPAPSASASSEEGAGQPRSPASSNSSGADYSRVSTPISPGCTAAEPQTQPGGPEPARAKRAPNCQPGWPPAKERLNPLLRQPVLRESSLAQVECQLDNKDMWDKFHSLNTEMIITKTGRRMFPVMKVQFYNLQPNARYAVSMDIVPVDSKRYRYAYHKSCWQVAGKADPSAETRLYPHPDSPFNGDLLSRQVISFEKVKLTNNEMDKSGHIILNSMHKYQPRVHLIELKVPPTSTATSTTNQQASSKPSTSSDHHNHHHHHNSHHHNHHHHNNHHQQPAPQLDIEGYRTFVFPETVFTAVTAYQNQLITKMKIDKNPFAKGFRDSSRLSDLDRNDPFDYMGSLGPSSRFVGQPPAGAHLEAAAAAGAHMDAYQLLASAANNPWYSAAAVAAAAQGANPFNPMGAAAACSTAQAAQLQATQIWLAAFSACLNGSGASGAGAAGPPPVPGLPPIGAPNENSGPESSGGSSSSANSGGSTHQQQQQ